jgi:hypothetical protein
LPLFLATSDCLLHVRPFGWDGNWPAVFAGIGLLVFGVFGLRNAEMLSALSTVRRADTPAWLYSILQWWGMTTAGTTNTRIAGFLSLAASAIMFKIAFFSIC